MSVPCSKNVGKETPINWGASAPPPSVDRAKSVTAAPMSQGRHVAVVAFHGIGTHLPNSMMSGAARQVADALSVRSPQPAPVVSVDAVEGTEGRIETRIDVTSVTADGKPLTVSVFEAYYSPFLKGKMSVAKILAWLAGVAFTNFSTKVLKRRIFDEEVSFRPQKHTKLFLALSLGTLVSVIAINGYNTEVLLLVAQGKFVPNAGHVALGAGCLLSLLTALAFGISVKAKVDARPVGPPPKKSKSNLAGFMVLIGTVIATASASTVLRFLSVSDLPKGHVPPSPLAVAFIVVALVVYAASWVARSFLLNYAGDLATYANGYYSSEHFEVRDSIRKRTVGVLEAVRSMDSVDSIVILAHSLGSVVAYDALNKFVLQYVKAGKDPKVRVLITFGSPLDKIAFLFRPTSEGSSELMTAAITSRSPLVGSLSVRSQMKWLNVYSNSDIIAGSLEFFDPRTEDGAVVPSYVGIQVENIDDVQNDAPVASHGQYDKHDALRSAWSKALSHLGV